MRQNCNITCRYGIPYDIELTGTKGSIHRTIDMLSKCCCFVCHNKLCKEPRDEKIECTEECQLYWIIKPCEEIKNN